MGENGIMLFGKFYRELDDKYRLMLPKQFKNQLADTLYLIKGYDGCLSVYQEEDFKAYVNQLTSLSYTHRDTRDIQRLGFSSVVELSLDKQGRVLIPTQTVQEYAISKEVVIVGVVNHLEIWNKKAWEDYESNNKDKFEEISETLPF